MGYSSICFLNELFARLSFVLQLIGKIGVTFNYLSTRNISRHQLCIVRKFEIIRGRTPFI